MLDRVDLRLFRPISILFSITQHTLANEGLLSFYSTSPFLSFNAFVVFSHVMFFSLTIKHMNIPYPFGVLFETLLSSS